MIKTSNYVGQIWTWGDYSQLTLGFARAVPIIFLLIAGTYIKYSQLEILFIVWNHSHKKRKASLEKPAEPAVFSLQLEFRKLLESSPRQPAWNINKKLLETTKQIKVKGLSSCFVLNLSLSGESCLTFNWHSSRSVSGISFFRVPTNDGEYSINWRNNTVAVITCDTVMMTI